MLKSLTSLLRGGDEDIIASNQPLDRTSSSLGIFFLEFIMNLPEGKEDPSLDLLTGAGSARTGDVLFMFKSIETLQRKIASKTRNSMATLLHSFYPTLLSMKNHLFNVFLSLIVGERSIKSRYPGN